jgi:K+-sensing histidine kinase KdpD
MKSAPKGFSESAMITALKQGSHFAISDDSAASANAGSDGSQGIGPQKGPPPHALSALQRYGLAVLSVAVMLGIGLLARLCHINVEGVANTLFLLAIAISAWYAGLGPAFLAFFLSGFAYDYFFIEPFYSIYITRADVPRFVVFILFALLVSGFGTTRRRVEHDLRHSRDKLEAEVKERRILNAELDKQSEQLRSANKELEAFAYSVSHDLRAPIRHIAGFTQMLQKHAGPVLDDSSREDIAMILDSAKRMGSLIDDLLDFSRIGRAEAQNTMVSLQQLVEQVVSDARQDIKDRDVTWRIGVLPPCYGDLSMLRLVFVNLISNAVKFTQTRSRAEIEIGSLNGRPNEVIVFVKDNGVGFNMKYKDKLFGVFQRLHSQEAFEGTGIGLATVQRIAFRHGGRVWAESSVDNGATFYVALPESGKTNL